jgi:hypothetical protein
LQTLAGQSPLTVTPLSETWTPLVFVPPAAAAQISTTDCGSSPEVSLTWQFVVDNAGLAGSRISARPLGDGACVTFRLLVTVTCSW